MRGQDASVRAEAAFGSAGPAGELARVPNHLPSPTHRSFTASGLPVDGLPILPLSVAVRTWLIAGWADQSFQIAMATLDGRAEGSNVEPRTIPFVLVTRAMVPDEWIRGTESVTPKQDRHILRTLRASSGTGRQCGKCGALEPPGDKFKKCGGCGVVHYCSIACQRKHWKAEHKSVCKITISEEQWANRDKQTMRRQCAECGALEPPGDKFKKCGGCRVVHYCSLICQKKHWKAEHKAVCKITKPAIEHCITVELPDVRLAWQYQDFVAAHSSEDAIGVSITSLEQWATPQRQLLLQETCTSLRDTGMPALIWMRVSVPYPKEGRVRLN